MELNGVILDFNGVKLDYNGVKFDENIFFNSSKINFIRR